MQPVLALSRLSYFQLSELPSKYPNRTQQIYGQMSDLRTVVDRLLAFIRPQVSHLKLVQVPQHSPNGVCIPFVGEPPSGRACWNNKAQMWYATPLVSHGNRRLFIRTDGELFTYRYSEPHQLWLCECDQAAWFALPINVAVPAIIALSRSVYERLTCSIDPAGMVTLAAIE